MLKMKRWHGFDVILCFKVHHRQRQ